MLFRSVSQSRYRPHFNPARHHQRSAVIRKFTLQTFHEELGRLVCPLRPHTKKQRIVSMDIDPPALVIDQPPMKRHQPLLVHVIRDIRLGVKTVPGTISFSISEMSLRFFCLYLSKKSTTFFLLFQKRPLLFHPLHPC